MSEQEQQAAQKWWEPIADRMAENPSQIASLPLTVRSKVERTLQDRGWVVARDQFNDRFYLPPAVEEPEIADLENSPDAATWSADEAEL